MRLFKLMCLCLIPLLVQANPIAFTNAHLIPIDGEEITNGLLVIEDGKIVYIGKMKKNKIPKNAEVRNCKGKVIMPGLVDTHSHVGGPAGADRSNPMQPETRAMESINVRSAGFRKAQAGGLTCINVMPGSGHLMSGQTIYLKLRRGHTIDQLTIPLEDGSLAGGMKMANGTNSRRKPPFPGTRAKSAAIVRAKFIKAQEYAAKIEQAGDDTSKLPPRDLGLEAMLDLLNGKRIVHHHTHRHDDILTVLRIAKEFHLKVVLHHVSDGWRVAKEIAEAKVPVSLIVVDSPGGKLEAKDLLMDTGAILEKAGVDVAFHTDDGITDSRLFFRSAALAARYGMSRGKALESLTLAGARMLDLDHRIGSLTKGKDADIIVLSGDPLSVYTKVLETWVEGEKVFDYEDPKDRLYATGGYGAGHDQEHEAHTHEIVSEEEWQ